MQIYRVPISELQKYVNPLDGAMWKCLPISHSEIAEALEAGLVEPRKWDDVVNTLSEQDSRVFHIARIATLVRCPSVERIVVVLENHSDAVRVYLNDGNHRLAAAYFRGDQEICAVLAASAPDRLHEILPGASPID